MTLDTNLQDVITRQATEAKSLRTLAGLLASLNTTDKTSLAAAINEVNTKTASAGASINDATPSTTTVYSSSKTDTQISDARAALKAEILGGAGSTVDTLKEIADLLASSDINDDNAIAALTTALGNRIRFDAAQTLTTAEKAQANSNTGSAALADTGSLATDYVAIYEAALL